MQTNNKVHIAYYPSWGIQDRKFFVSDIPAKNLTHIYLAFLSVNGSDGSIKFLDKPADTQVGFNSYNHSIDWNISNNGNLGELKKLKQSNPNYNNLIISMVLYLDLYLSFYCVMSKYSKQSKIKVLYFIDPLKGFIRIINHSLIDFTYLRIVIIFQPIKKSPISRG